MGYHVNKIQKGKLGEFSKIKEEFEEAVDALEQHNPVMMLVELSDMIGAIEAFAKTQYNIKLSELINMKEATQRAFKTGSRT